MLAKDQMERRHQDRLPQYSFSSAWWLAGLSLSILFFFLEMAVVHGDSVSTKLLSIAELAARSDTVVVGQVLLVQSSWSQNRKMIFTRVDLKVDQVLKGDLSGNQLSFYQPGGRVGDTVSAIAGTPSFHPGERVLLFLSKKRDGQLGLVERYLGKFSIEADPVSGKEMAVRRIPGVTAPLDATPLEQAIRLIRSEPER